MKKVVILGLVIVGLFVVVIFAAAIQQADDGRPLSERVTAECRKQFPYSEREVQNCLAGYIVRMAREKAERDSSKIDDVYRRTR
ncbi:hypothetical protein [Rhodoplanes sp. Z2-YC6860]|uniref:hypothetical protein n=1 Tax=Rhodoplanes sp. Z2-YC6860 TaxID=674703 RepID=UPI0012ED43F1|nr:hypothetical protein [Rhodoplanes sp. Z2-YC6860]